MSPNPKSFMPFFLTGETLVGCENPFNQDRNSVRTGLFGAIAVISILSSVIVALMIFYNPKLRIHPSKLIGYMCVCEAASCFAALLQVINPKSFICYFGIHYVWSWTTG
jgi:hypothetical protein